MSNAIFPSDVRGLTFTVVKTMENNTTIQESPTFVTTRITNSPLTRWHWRLEYTVLFDDILRPNPSYTYTDFQIMMGFCQARYSNFDDFLYLDPDANTVGPGIITATWQPRTIYMLGDIVIASGHAQQVSVATNYSRSGYVTPTFSTGGGSVVDGDLTWTDIGAVAGTGWPNPKAYLQVVSDGTTSYSPLQIHIGGQNWEDVTDLAGALTVYDNGTVTTNYTVTGGGFAIAGFSAGGIYLTWTTPPTGPVTADFQYYYRVRLEEDATDFEKFANQMWSMGGSEGQQGKGYIKLVQHFPMTQPDSSAAVVWTGTGSPIPVTRPPTPTPPPGPPSGGSSTDDMLTWCLMPTPARTTTHLRGDLYAAFFLDTDAGYPGTYPSGVFWWIKNTLGHPWDVEKYNGTYISHWMTEDGDPTDQPACHAAGYGSCWIDPFAYKRFITPVPMMPRFFTQGTTITIDTPGPNTFVRTTNCESSFTNINLGDVRAVTMGPFNMSWGGSIGTQPTIQNDYYYGGRISGATFKDKESTFYVQGYGRIAWKYYRLISGAWVLQQSSINNIVASGGCPVPSFPCGPGKPWF